jgi:serine/threonine-protein kinase
MRASQSKPVHIGQVIGSYRLVRELGTGGMGTVYEAQQTVIGRRVAIKILHAEYSSQPQSAFRFLNEARAVNIVQHPGLVDVYELGHLENGTPYIIMEFLDGESLAARLDRGAVTPADAIRIARQMASALAAAHGKGIIHRDLKPENVMLVRDGESHAGERVKVLDFGIAKILRDDVPADRDKRTRTGMIMGTPRYMAPEQCRGTGIYDARIDVYALGIMIFELIAGRPPFLAEGLGELMYQHMTVAPPALATLQPDTPPDLATLVNAMLAKSASDRPWMNQVAIALERLGAPKAIGVGTVALPDRPPPPRTRSTLGQAVGERLATPPPRRRRGVAFFAGAFVVAVLLGGVPALLLLPPKKPPPQPMAPPPPPTPTPTPTPTPSAPRRVHWTITTTPLGATVRTTDGELLGRTPWSRAQAAQSGETTLYLDLAGHVQRQVVLSRDRDEELDERLAPIPRWHRPTPHDLQPAGEAHEDTIVH